MFIFAGCGKKEKTDTAVARAGNAVLTLDALKEKLPPQLDDSLSVEDKINLVVRWVDEELLYQEALRRGIDNEEKIKDLLERSKKGILVAQLLDREFEKISEVADKDMQVYYEANKEDFTRTNLEIRAQHILVEDKTKAARVRKRLLTGERFATVAREESLDSSALDVGDLGYFSKREADPQLWDACLKLKVNVISRPIQTDMGYHITQVIDKKDEGTIRDIEQVRSQIANKIRSQRHGARLRALIENLRQKTKYSIEKDLLTKTDGNLDSTPEVISIE